MAQAHTQISAYISEETKNLVERYVRARGVKKGFLVESALLHHLQALEKLPADVIIPPRLMPLDHRRNFVWRICYGENSSL